MTDKYILPFQDIMNGQITPERAEFIKSQLGSFTCARSTHITEFAHARMEEYGRESESHSYLFLEKGSDRLLGFFTLGLTSVEWDNIEKSEGWKNQFSKKQRRKLSYGLFKRRGFVGMFTIGELARDDNVSSRELCGAEILAAALQNISLAQNYTGGCFVLVDSRRKLFERLYSEAGFVEIAPPPPTKANPNHL